MSDLKETKKLLHKSLMLKNNVFMQSAAEIYIFIFVNIPFSNHLVSLYPYQYIHHLLSMLYILNGISLKYMYKS